MTAPTTTRRWVLASRPTSTRISEHLALESIDVAAPGAGQFVVEPILLRAAPPMYKVMVSGSVADGRPTPIGTPVSGNGIGQVVASEHPDFAVGTYVHGGFPWQERVLSDGRSLVPVQTFVPSPGISLAAPLHVLGGPGLSAWFALRDLGRPRLGDTLVVSTAAGAVGAIACQLGRLQGCRVVGITSTEAKADWLRTTIGVDAAIAYRTDDVAARLREHCPDGIDIYFDNVGGPTLDTVLDQIADGARIIVCGASSQYDKAADWAGPQRYFNLVFRQAQMLGFYVFKYASEFPAARKRLGDLLAAGRLTYTEDVVEGFERAPEAFDRVLASENLGLQVIRLRPD